MAFGLLRSSEAEEAKEQATKESLSVVSTLAQSLPKDTSFAMTSRSSFPSKDQEWPNSIQLQDMNDSGSNLEYVPLSSSTAGILNGNNANAAGADEVSSARNPKSLKPSASSVSLASSSGAISLPASFCDTDAALFTFDYEMLDEEDDKCDPYDHGPSHGRNLASSFSLKYRSGTHQHGEYNALPQGEDVEKGKGREKSFEHEFILFGFDLSHLSGSLQLAISATGVLVFNMLYGYLQELIQIKIAGRGFAIFLGACQFAGYAFWSWVLARLRARRIGLRRIEPAQGIIKSPTISMDRVEYTSLPMDAERVSKSEALTPPINSTGTTQAPLMTYFALSMIRAIDLGLTNLSMKYLNYPAKTLIKSSRVIFTMLMGIVIWKKKYKSSDYVMVAMLVAGLGMFLHADMTTNAVFHPLGVVMLVSVAKAKNSVCR